MSPPVMRKNKLKLFALHYLPLSLRDFLITLLVLLITAFLCLLLTACLDDGFFVPLIFVLGVLITARLTNGYFYGILASLIGVFAVNYAFTYPYFAFNFTIPGYSATFLSMFAVSVTTSTMTTRILQQEKLKHESETEKFRSNLLRAVSHDLRTPLTSIIGSISALLDNESAYPAEKRRELLMEARDDAQWLLQFVENILSITRIGGASTKIKIEHEAIEEIIGESIRHFKKRFPGIELQVSVPGELLMLPMDAVLISQVMANLLENAATHGKCTTRIAVTVECTGDYALFSVSDDGTGIPDSVFPFLFTEDIPTVLEKNAGKKNMGIGLSVCMAIIRAHGGIMTAQNKTGGGAVFTFSLPLNKTNTSWITGGLQ